MKVKINTKEKFHVITIEETILPANMTEKIKETLLPFLNNSIKNIIINFENVNEIEEPVVNALIDVQQQFYEEYSSMVICSVKPEVEKYLDENEWLEIMNVTPTESEAWDIVQMEEIEREFN